MQVADLVKVTMVFQLSGDVEIAEFSSWGQYADAPVSDADWTTALQNTAAAARSAWIGGMDNAFFSGAVGLENTIAGRYGADGKLINEQAHPSTEGDWIGGDENSMPWQTSMCVNIYSYTPGTFIPNNRRRRGRVFLPPFGTSCLRIGNSGEMVDTLPAHMLSEMKDWWTAFSATANNWVLGVNSQAAVAFYPATDITTDDRLDTQRRRTNKEPRVRSVLTY